MSNTPTEPGSEPSMPEQAGTESHGRTTRLRRIEQRLVGEVTSYERAVLIHGAAWFFLVLCSYYVLRPIREQISATYGIENLSWMFWAGFAAMLIAVPLYSILVGHFHRRWLVPIVYAIFVIGLLAFWVAMRSIPESQRIWVARGLFVFISVYGLFIVSFFWSVMGDLLSTEQGRRIFGVIMSGGSVGQLVGSQLAGRLVARMGVSNLLLIPAALLAGGLLVYFSLERSHKRLAHGLERRRTGEATGGNPFSGFAAVAKSRYLLAICFFGLVLASCSTTVYFQQAEIVEAAYETREARAEFFADVNFYVSLVTMVFQFLIVGWLMRSVGVGWTLACLPLVYIAGISSLAISPTIGVLAVISVLGRSAEYGIANPAREVLFTAVIREDRYKAKSFIDTVVRRAGDSTVGTLYRGFRESAGFAMSTLSWMVIPLAVAWTGLAIFIGHENQRIVARRETTEEAGSI